MAAKNADGGKPLANAGNPGGGANGASLGTIEAVKALANDPEAFRKDWNSENSSIKEYLKAQRK